MGTYRRGTAEVRIQLTALPGAAQPTRVPSSAR
jgi:hypothetical protein